MTGALRAAAAEAEDFFPGDLFTGAQAQSLFDAADMPIEGFEWSYGFDLRLNEFPPHVDLDGVQFTDFGDDVLANPESFPASPFFHPGDHDGCACAAIVLVGGVDDDEARLFGGDVWDYDTVDLEDLPREQPMGAEATVHSGPLFAPAGKLDARSVKAGLPLEFGAVAGVLGRVASTSLAGALGSAFVVSADAGHVSLGSEADADRAAAVAERRAEGRRAEAVRLFGGDSPEARAAQAELEPGALAAAAALLFVDEFGLDGWVDGDGQVVVVNPRVMRRGRVAAAG